MTSHVLQDLLYAQCWEDPRLDRRAFGIRPDDTVFTITSGGCNALAFLLDDPRRLIALDYNVHQSRILELKIAALGGLSHDALLAFVGVRPSRRRVCVYRRAVRPHLHDDAREYWDARAARIAGGVLHAGRYESYLQSIRTWVRRVVGRDVVDAFFAIEDPAERARLYRRRWDSPRWRALTNVLLGRRLLSLLFDAAFFAQLEEETSFGANFRARVEHALTELSPRENPFLHYVLRGGFDEERALPTWLKPEHHERIRTRTDRVEIVTASCVDWLAAQPADSVRCFNFTNIFEWLTPGAYRAALEQAVRVGCDDAVLTYRNLLVPRSRPADMAERLDAESERAAALHREDRSFLYRRYVIERVRKGGASCAA